MSKKSNRTALPPGGRTSFEEAAEAVMRKTQAAFMRLITAVPQTKTAPAISNSADLHRALEINPRLAWQVFRIAHAENPVAEAVEVPKPAAMNRFLDAARKRHVADDAIKQVSQTFEQFEQLVREHAGDRRSFDSMVSSLAGGGDSSPLAVPQRRAAFIANSHIFGVQARTRLACYIFGPNENADMADLLILRGFIDLRWLRLEQAPFQISRFRTFKNDGAALSREPKRHPLDPQGAADPEHGLWLLREFCSEPPPRIRATNTPDGFTTTEIVGDDVGNAAARTLMMGEWLEGTEPAYQSGDGDRFVQVSITLRAPCEALVQDVLVYNENAGGTGEGGGMFGAIQPKVFTFSDTHTLDGRTWNRAMDALPPHATLKYLGHGAEVMHSTDVPRYPEMVRYAMKQRGWDAAKFDVWRCRVEFPVLPSTTMVQFEKPAPPAPKPKSKD